MAVRYDKRFESEINKVITAYNRKIARLSKTGKYEILPEKFSKEALKSLKAQALSRKEVRRTLKDMQSFIERGGEKIISVNGTKMPKYLHTNIKRYRRILSSQTSKRMKKLETTHPIENGREQPFTFSQYGTGEYLTLKAKRDMLLDKDLSSLSISQLEAYLKKLKANTKERDLNVWKNNYIAMLEDSALSYGYEPDKLEIIVERLKNLSPEDFDDLSFLNKNIREIVYYYKALENIETANELKDVGEDVINNLDSIYEDLDDLLAKYG